MKSNTLTPRKLDVFQQKTLKAFRKLDPAKWQSTSSIAEYTPYTCEALRPILRGLKDSGLLIGERAGNGARALRWKLTAEGVSALGALEGGAR